MPGKKKQDEKTKMLDDIPGLEATDGEASFAGESMRILLECSALALSEGVPSEIHPVAYDGNVLPHRHLAAKITDAAAIDCSLKRMPRKGKIRSSDMSLAVIRNGRTETEYKDAGPESIRQAALEFARAVAEESAGRKKSGLLSRLLAGTKRF